jgi:NADH dehydrogenase [ubiquinone] 1 alpha subcomplex assembly factor 7
MSGLGESLRKTIRLQGPITVAQFMATVLGDPVHGYYAGNRGRDPLGVAGDFITAPEISQMFGELIGLWCADRWQSMGAPARVLLVELGPGRGTLMADAVRAASAVPAFHQALEIHLVETSPTFREAQEERLGDHDVHWHDAVTALPDGPSLIIANEFFDALPIHQFVATDAGWRERLVGLAANDEDSAAADLEFRCAPGPTPSLALVDALAITGAPGAVAETCPAAISIAGAIADRIAADGGAALIIDYGDGGGTGDSLQAVHRHQPCDALAHPGECDLTAHVDFAAVARAATEAGAATYGPVPQGRFLQALGIVARAAALARDATHEQAADIDAALARLTDADQMGTLFKVLAIGPPGGGAPAGFVA